VIQIKLQSQNSFDKYLYNILVLAAIDECVRKDFNANAPELAKHVIKFWSIK